MKLSRIFAISGLAVLLGAVAAVAGPGTVTNPYGDPCKLIEELGKVFSTLRILAFAGAAFVLAGFAWTFITKGWGGEGTKLDDAKNKGIGMLIGFVLLFGLGLIMSFLPGFINSDCQIGNYF